MPERASSPSHRNSLTANPHSLYFAIVALTTASKVEDFLSGKYLVVVRHRRILMAMKNDRPLTKKISPHK